jgi:hypothetical protein
MTRVSVILPVHNAGPYLATALASLLVQTHRDIRIIAIDDGSTDGSAATLRAAQSVDPRVVLVSRENRGLVATLNEGLGLADTDLVARMDADDIAYPERIARQVEAFAADTRLGVLGTNFVNLYTPTRVTAAAPPQLTGPGERAILGRFCTCLRHPTVMFRRSRIAGDALHFDPRYPHAEDFDLFRRLADTTPLAELPAPLLAYRLHPDSVSVTRMAAMCGTHLRILGENLAQHYPTAAVPGIERLAAQPDTDNVDAAAQMIRRLDALLPAQPAHERAAFETGLVTTVHFIFALLCRQRAYDLAHRFIEGARCHRLIRRRERAILPTPVAHVGMTVSEWQVGLQRRLGSRLLSEALPGFTEIAEQARAIGAAAGRQRSHHAA